MNKLISCILLLFAAATTHLFAQQPPILSEQFETGCKNSYEKQAATLSSGTWELDNAVLGKIPSDAKNGIQSVRIKNGGIYLLQDLAATGTINIQIATAIFGKDKPTDWQVFFSVDAGNTWIPAGKKTTTAGKKLSTSKFSFATSKPFRICIRNFSDNRLNVDDLFIYTGNGNPSQILITDKASNILKAPAPTKDIAPAADHTAISTPILPGRDKNMTMGNPSHARTTDPNNYLIVKEQYTLSYNNSRGSANWVSWHLSNAWKGEAKRCNCFEKDKDLPTGFFHASTSDYNNSGFDRGHICPSDDRDASSEDNAYTFLMDNIIPQAPNLNQKTWEHLEAYGRKLCDDGNELYIIAGAYGKGGSGKNGAMQTLANGKITVPAQCWKVIVVLPIGDNDLQRVSPNTRVIAVDMPNKQSVSSREWTYYRTSVDAIEKATGLNVLDKLPESVQKVIEAKVDNGGDR